MGEPIYTDSKFAVRTIVQTVRRRVSKHGQRVGAVLSGPVLTALLDHWPKAKMEEALARHPEEVAHAVLFMPKRPLSIVIRNLVILPNSVGL
ncbi:hypothetical protein FHG66_14030 [Rubellimicrobium rubrum]|uniref:Uncharacterized protein n=1 Tax=Rubellimicrobium rubrum TaxID=2585369 RepID=A0A5C4MWH1_9RHOB|nr:hypothetical protein [Rubellimicrobium rubrum]TNC48467.1 hypothetical protein FHG66_14030 [Rubellimicrobium rubrum]